MIKSDSKDIYHVTKKKLYFKLTLFFWPFNSSEKISLTIFNIDNNHKCVLIIR